MQQNPLLKMAKLLLQYVLRLFPPSVLLFVKLVQLQLKRFFPLSSSRFYSCLDARFYDDETITVVLADNSEQEEKERILAQLPLSSIYMEQNHELEFGWNSNQRC